MTTTDHRDAATAQDSDYSGVTTADLAEVLAALSTVPATLQVMAVLGRVKGELDRRNRQERIEATRAIVTRREDRATAQAVSGPRTASRGRSLADRVLADRAERADRGR